MNKIRIIVLGLLGVLFGQGLFAAKVSGFIRDGKRWVGVYRTGVLATCEPKVVFELMIRLKKTATFSSSRVVFLLNKDIQKELCRHKVSGLEVALQLLVDDAVALCSTDDEIFLVKKDFLLELQEFFPDEILQSDVLTNVTISSKELVLLLKNILQPQQNIDL